MVEVEPVSAPIAEELSLAAQSLPCGTARRSSRDSSSNPTLRKEREGWATRPRHFFAALKGPHPVCKHVIY